MLLRCAEARFSSVLSLQRGICLGSSLHSSNARPSERCSFPADSLLTTRLALIRARIPTLHFEFEVLEIKRVGLLQKREARYEKALKIRQREQEAERNTETLKMILATLIGIVRKDQ